MENADTQLIMKNYTFQLCESWKIKTFFCLALYRANNPLELFDEVWRVEVDLAGNINHCLLFSKRYGDSALISRCGGGRTTKESESSKDEGNEGDRETERNHCILSSKPSTSSIMSIVTVSSQIKINVMWLQLNLFCVWQRQKQINVIIISSFIPYFTSGHQSRPTGRLCAFPLSIPCGPV